MELTIGHIRVTFPDDIRNSPKKLFIKDLSIAFLKGDFDIFFEHITEDIAWTFIGKKKFHGDEVKSVFKLIPESYTFKEFKVDTIITHGTAAVVNGNAVQEDGSHYAYCCILTFTSAGKKGKIKELTSYVTIMENE